MSALLTKVIKLFNSDSKKELKVLVIAYIKYCFVNIWFKLTRKKIDSNLIKTYKDWVIFNYLKSKYRKFLKNFKTESNPTHEYSDIIWWCWFQGEAQAPELCKKCLDTIKKQIPDKQIKIITEENMYSYIDFPQYIKEKYKKGIISKTHLSDLLRLELLLRYGGTWIDSTVYCTAYPSFAFNTPLFIYKTDERNDPGIAAQSWFISAEKNNPILRLTLALHYEYWKKNKAQIHYFLLYFFMNIAAQYYKDEWNAIPWYSDVPCFIMQREYNKIFTEKRWNQLCKMSDIHKLSYKVNTDERNDTIYQHIINN